VMISSQYSPPLANALVKGTVDAAFLRREQGFPELAFRFLVKESLVVVLPSDHRLAALKAISPADLVGETFVTVSHTAPVLRGVIDNYLKRSGINIKPAHEIDHVVMGMSLIASTRGVGLLPAYAQNFLTPSVTSRPLQGKYADCRSGPRLQKVEQISHPKAFAFEIGRTDRSCLEGA
jgi:LysR family hca operon transcriptional activator